MNVTNDENTGAAASADAAGTAAAAVSTSEGSTASDSGQGQGDAGNTGEGEGANGDKGTGEAEASTGAPESYEAFTVPDGYVLEGARLESTQTLFKEVGLSQANAQKLIDAFVSADGENATALQELAEQARQSRIEGWGKEAETQLGDKYAPTLEQAKAAYNGLRTEAPELYEAVHKAFAHDGEGWGNHPAMIQLLAFYGRKLNGDSIPGLGGSTAGGRELSTAERMYPGMQK